MIRPFLVAFAILCVPLAGCSTSFDAGATPRPTAVPRLLTRVAGTQTEFTTAAFTSTEPWRIQYQVHCPHIAYDVNAGIFQVLGIDPKHPNGDEQLLVYSMTRTPKGSSDSVQPGRWKLHIKSQVGCRWNIAARTM